MGDTEADWLPSFVDVGSAKTHGSRSFGGLGPFGTSTPSSLTSVQKRSLKRAITRSLHTGYAWYKGQCITPQHFGLSSNSVSQSKTRFASDVQFPCFTHKPQSRVTTLQWNADGLSRSKYEDCLRWFACHGADIGIITETHWTHTSEWLSADWYVVHSGSNADRGGGILILVSKKFCNLTDISWHAHIDARLVHLRIHFPHKSIDVVAAYQHVLKTFHPSVARTQWWKKLDELLQNLPTRNLLFLMGDFNCSLPCIPRLVHLPSFKMHEGRKLGRQHPDMSTFVALLQRFHLVAVNTWDHTLGPTMHQLDDGHSRIDYVFTRLATADSSSKQVCYFEFAPIIARQMMHHHVPIMANFAFHRHSVKRVATSAIPSSVVMDCKMAYHLQTPQWQHCAADVCGRLTCLNSDCTTLDDISQTLTQGTLHHFGADCKVKSSTLDDTAVFTLTKWHHHRQFIRHSDPTLQACFHNWYHHMCFEKLDKSHRRHARQRKKARILSMLSAASQAFDAHDSYQLYRAVALHCPKQPRKRIKLRGPQGHFLTPVEETAAYCHFVQTTWAGEPLQLDNRAISAMPFTLTELQYELARLPALKSVAPLYAPAVMWKAQAEPLAQLLYPMLQRWWLTQPAYIPTEWKDGWTCFIPKPGKSCTSLANLRTLALQAPLGKMVIKLIARKARVQSMSTLCAIPQFAYLPNRGTMQALLRVESHCRYTRGLLATQVFNVQTRRVGFDRLDHCGGLQLLLDLNKAFDQIPRELLSRALQLLPVDEDIAHLLQQWHIGTHYHVSSNGSSKSIPVHSGVRQGCCAAPFLWAALMNLLFETWCEHVPKAWLLKHITIYADDIHIGFTYTCPSDFDTSVRYLGLILDGITSLGLKINETKSQVIWRGAGKLYAKCRRQKLKGNAFCVQTLHGEKRFAVVSKALYLGTYVSYTSFEDQTVQLRLQVAKGTFRRLQFWLLKKHGINKRLKLEIWKTCVATCSTYAIFFLGLTEKSLHSIVSAWTSMLRKMMGNVAHVTRLNDLEFYQQYQLDHPLFILHRLAIRMYSNYQQALRRALPHDIIHTCDLTAWNNAIILLSRQLDRLALPSVPSISSSSEVHTCDICQAVFSTHTTLKRHKATKHQQMKTCVTQFLYDRDQKGGVSTCAHCGLALANWRELRTHIEHGACPVFFQRFDVSGFSHDELAQYAIPSQVDTPHLQDLMSADAQPTVEIPIAHEDMKQRFGAYASELDVESLRIDQEVCEYASKHCIQCSRVFSRVSELNAHIRKDHHLQSVETTSRGIQLTCKYAAVSPCDFCNQIFSRQHICPIFVQIAMLQEVNQPAPNEALPFHCLICQESFETNSTLYLHLRRVHRVKPNNWDFGRDSAYGTPVCAHCGTAFANLENLRIHIVQGRCDSFNPDKTSDSPPDEFIQQALLTGSLADLWADDTRCAQLMSSCAVCHKQSSQVCSLGHHLASHPDSRRQAVPLAQLLEKLFRPKLGCVCIPPISKRKAAHGCLPFLQASMVHQASCPHRLIIPYVIDEKLLQQMVHYLPDTITQAATHALTSRNFEQLWLDRSMLEALQQLCFSCGDVAGGQQLLTHMHTHHSVGLHVPQLIVQMLSAILTSWITPEGCKLCGQKIDTTAALWLKIHSSRCPTLLNLAVWFTEPANIHLCDGNYPRRFSHATTDGLLCQHGPPFSTKDGGERRSQQATKVQSTKGQCNSRSRSRRSHDATSQASGHTGNSTRPRSSGPPSPGGIRAFFERVKGRASTSSSPSCAELESAETTEASQQPSQTSPTVECVDSPSKSCPTASESPDGQKSSLPATLDSVCEEPHCSPGWLPPLSPMEWHLDGGSPNQDCHSHGELADSTQCHARPLEGGHGLGAEIPFNADQGQDPGSGPMEVGTIPETGSISSVAIGASTSLSVATGWCPHAPAPLATEQACRPDLQATSQVTSVAMTDNAIVADLKKHPRMIPLGRNTLMTWCLLNADATQCYVNASVTAVLWCLLNNTAMDASSWGPHLDEIFVLLMKGQGNSMTLRAEECLARMFMSWPRGYGHQEDASEFIQHFIKWIASPVIANAWEKRFVHGTDLEQTMVVEKGDNHCPIPVTSDMIPTSDQCPTLTQMLHNWYTSDNMITALVTHSVIVCFQVSCGGVSSQELSFEDDVMIRHFTGNGVEHCSSLYRPMALLSYSGDRAVGKQGHYCALLRVFDRLRPPAHGWLFCDDNCRPRLYRTVPTQVKGQISHVFLIRQDCVNEEGTVTLPVSISPPKHEQQIGNLLQCFGNL